MTTASITPRFGELAGDLAAGTGDGRAALVFLPGLTFDRTMWRPALRSLRTIDPGRTTLALDMPGEGESIGTFRGLEVAIDQLHVAIAAAGIEKPVLVGHSGSAIGAMFYAMKYPVRGIVNVDAVLDNNAFSARLRALEPQLRNGGLPAVWDELFAGLHAERSGPAGEAMLRATSRPRPDVMLGYWAPVLAPPPTAENAIADAIASLRAQQTPYTLVFGEEPDTATRAWMAERFPEATVIALPNSGHFPHVAHPDAFARILASVSSYHRDPSRRGRQERGTQPRTRRDSAGGQTSDGHCQKTSESKDMRRLEVSINSGGVSCAATIYRPPSSAGPVGCVVMGNGITLTRRDGIPDYAQRFADAGLVVLAFDYRHWGDSEGDPRRWVSLRRQLEDWRAAVGYARELDGVDPEQIVVWGMSLGGGLALMTAAADPRIAATVALVPLADGLAAMLQPAPPSVTLRLMWRAMRGALARGPVTIPVAGPPGSFALLAAPEALPGFERLASGNGWRNEVNIAGSLRAFARFRPVHKADRIRGPVLVQLGERDRMTPLPAIEKLSTRAPHARLTRYQIDHFECFWPEHIDHIADDQLDFLRRHLVVQAIQARELTSELMLGRDARANLA